MNEWQLGASELQQTWQENDRARVVDFELNC